MSDIKIDKDTLKQLLQNLHGKKWTLDQGTLETMRKHPSEEWLSRISESFLSEGVRGAVDLARLLKMDDGNDSRIASRADVYKKLVLDVEGMRGDDEKVEEWMEELRKLREEGVKTDENFVGSMRDDEGRRRLCVSIAAVDKVIRGKHGFNLRSTQLMSLVMFLDGRDKGGTLEQVKVLLVI